jgi:hypothetical protein
MTKTPTIAQPICDLLDEFFAEYQPNAIAAVKPRIASARVSLERALDVEGERILTSGHLATLNAERAANPEGAFSRTGRADDLYYALPLCLDPVHLVGSRAERETQVDVIAALADFLWRRRLISGKRISECAIIEFDIAIERGRAALTRENALS